MQDSLGGCEPERHHTKDGRQCVLYSVEGDAEPVVSTTSCPKGHHWSLLVSLFHENKEVYCKQHTSLAEGKVLLLMVTIFLPFLVTSLPERCSFHPSSLSSLPPLLPPPPSSLPPLCTLPPSLLQAVLADADIAVL